MLDAPRRSSHHHVPTPPGASVPWPRLPACCSHATAGAGDASARAPEAPWATANGRVLAIVRVNNVVYVGGKFTQMIDRNGTVLTRSHLAAVSAADGHVLPWNPGANNTVRSLAVSTDGKTIYIGGDFTSLGGAPRSHAAAEAAIAPASTRHRGHPAGVGAEGGRLRLHDRAAGRAGVSGRRLPARRQPRPAAAGVGLGGERRAHRVAPEGRRRRAGDPAHVDGSVLFVGGLFHHMNGAHQPHLVAINPASGALAPWKSHPDDSILTLAANALVPVRGRQGRRRARALLHARTPASCAGRSRRTAT